MLQVVKSYDGASQVASRELRGPDMSLRSLLDVLWRRRFIIAFVALVAVMAGVAYVTVAPRKYTAVASMLVDTKRPQFSREDTVSESAVDQAAIDSQVETLLSESVG